MIDNSSDQDEAQIQEQRLAEWRMTLLIAAIAIPVILLASFAYRWLTAPTFEEVKRTVAELNKRLPAKTDDITGLEKVTLGDKEIVYRYNIRARSSGLKGDDLKSALLPHVRPAICSAPMLQTLMRMDYVIRYRYYGDDRSLITEIVTKRGDCASLSGCTLIHP
jgi:hypothetical protein